MRLRYVHAAQHLPGGVPAACVRSDYPIPPSLTVR
jgi:hypothetical protein